MLPLSLAILLYTGHAPAAWCDDLYPEPKRVDAIVVMEGTSSALEGKTGKTLKDLMLVSGETVIRVKGHPVKKTSIVMDALSVGVARIKLTDVDGKVDEVLVVVEKPVPRKKPK